MADKIDYIKDRRGRKRFPITHEKGVRDSNWVRLEEKLKDIELGKQDALVSGETIKTIGGQSILGSGDIPIQAGDTNAVQYVAQELSEAQKAQTLANIGGASAESVAAETARATAAEEDIMDAVDGKNVETVTVLPAASASTVGKIYYVGPDDNGEYARYRGIESGGSYSFLPIGTTEMNLLTYATNQEVSQLRQEVDGLNMTASGSKTGSGWLSIELPKELEAGKKYTLVFTKNVNMSGISVSTSTSSSSANRVDIDIVTLDYFAQNTTTLSDFIPSGNAKFLLFWCGGSVQISVNVTGEGLTDIVEKNKTDISTLNGKVDTLNELIPALGKGETQTLSPTTNAGRIDNNGEIVSESGYYYTDPIPVSKGDVILLSAFVSATASPISKTDSAGSFYKPLIGVGKGLSTYAYYVIEDGFVALSYAISASYPNVSFQKTSLSSLASLADGINSLQEQVDELTGTKDYSASFPEYVFGIESGSFSGREYATMIYPEAIINKPGTPEEGQPPVDKTIPKGLLNGTIRMAMQKPKLNTTYFNNFRTKTETIAKTAIIGGPGLLNKTFNFDYIRANRYNGQNKKMFLLVVGASITQQGGYVGQIDRLGDMDNTDIGGINVKSLGSNVGTVTPTINYEYGGQTKTITTHTEGRAGWTTYGIANWPFEGRMDGAVDTLGGEGMWYASGMATKTPYDSNTPGHAFESWTGSGTQRCALFSAVFGRYKPDYCEDLWIALHNFHTRFRSGAHTMWYYSTGAEYVSGATVPAYNGATSNALMEQFFDAICYNPDNVFYDRDMAREYTGAYVWTHKTAFSIEKWVERYRTLDDNGNQLTLGNGTGTFVTASNINNPVCTPTFVLCGMGANDWTGMGYDDWSAVSGTSEAVKTGILSLLDDLHEQLPAAHFGYCVPRQSGVFFPELWFNIGIIGEMGYYTPNRSGLNTMMMGEMPELDVDNDYNYVPVYFTSSPVSGQAPHYVGDFDNPNGNKLVVTGADLGHVGTEWEESVAYQILAWMYWCLQ